MAGSLARRDYTVKIICLQDKLQDLPSNEQKEGFQINRVKLLTSRLPSFFNTIKYIEFILQAKKKINQFKADIIHCHDFQMLPVGMAVKKGRRIIYDSHELETHRNGIGKFESIMVGVLESLFTRRVDACITVNEDISDILSDKYHVKFDYIYNAYSPHEITVRPENSIRSLINATDNQFVVIYPGVISYGRGLSKVVEAVPLINENILFVIFGDGPYKEKLKENIRQTGLHKRVFMFDPVPYEMVFQYMATSDLGIMPTLNTSLSYTLELGNKFFQYIAAGIPVGSSDQPVKKKLIEKHDIGFTFDAENTEDIAQKINQLYTDQDRYQKYRKNIRKAMAELCWEEEEKKLLNIYANL
jgi:glycosyltransferase involved in cell wall biosynthesis